MRWATPLVAILVTGCVTTTAPLTEEDIAVCKQLMPHSGGWIGIVRPPENIATIHKTNKLPKPHALGAKYVRRREMWFENPTKHQYGVCAFESCGVDDCYWLKRIYYKSEGYWYFTTPSSHAIYYSG